MKDFSSRTVSGVPPVCRSARPNILQGDNIDSSHLDTTGIFGRGNELLV